MKEESKKNQKILGKKASTLSIKVSENSTFKKTHKFSQIDKKFPEQSSISEIKLEENSHSIDRTYLSFLKRDKNVYVQSTEGNIVTTNISENKQNGEINNSMKKENFVIDEEHSFIGNTLNANYSASSFNNYGYISSEEKLNKLVKKAKKPKFILSRNHSQQVSNSSMSNQVFEIKNHSSYNNFELSKKVFDILHEAPADSLVILPPRYISLPHILLSTSISIRGSPGTLVEINNGHIDVATEDPSIKTKILISECSFVFNLELRSFVERFKQDKILSSIAEFNNSKFIMPLIKIRENSVLEIRDCDFRSIVHEEEKLIEEDNENRLIKETCFVINDQSSKLLSGELLLSSTICSNFYRIISAFNTENIVIEKCHFSDCVNNAIEVNSFNKFTLRNTTIANNQIAIKIIQDYFQCVNKNSKILMVENEITQNSSFGIYISSNKTSFSLYNESPKDNQLKGNLYIEILRNSLHQNSSKAVLIENILAETIIFNHNEIKFNLDTGILLDNVFFLNQEKIISNETEENIKKIYTNTQLFIENFNLNLNSSFEKFNLVIDKNIIKENKNSQGIKIKNSINMTLLFESNSISNNLEGFCLENFDSNMVKAVIKNCNFTSNLDNGICISNALLSFFYFINNNIDKNFSRGISLTNKIDSIEDCFMYFINNTINQNKHGGIIFQNFRVYIDNCKIIDNGNWAVEIVKESNKNSIKFLNYNDKFALNVNSPVGGNWGQIGNKSSICSTDSCITF